MNIEAGSKRSRNCVSPPPPQDDSTTTIPPPQAKAASAPVNDVWQQWTANFRASKRLHNDLLCDDGIDSAVERHMSLSSTNTSTASKKRPSLDSDSDDSDDDEGNYYKLDDPPIQQQQQQLRQHPLEFTPSGFFPAATRLGPQQVTPQPISDALPVCTLRRYGHGDEEEDDDRIPPPPPSFMRYPSSKKRAVGVARPHPEEDLYTRTGSIAPPLPQFTRGVSSLAVEREGLKLDETSAHHAFISSYLAGVHVPAPPAAVTRNAEQASNETATKLNSLKDQGTASTCSATSPVAAP